MAKKNNDYFKLIEQQTAYCVEASNLLEEIFCKFARHAVFNLQIKDQIDRSGQYSKACMEEIVRLIYLYDQQEHVYFMGAPDVMESAIKYAPHIPRCVGAFPDPWEIIDRAIKYQCQKAQLFAPYYNQEMIDKAHAHGIRCTFFYCDDPAEVGKLLDIGVDTILTNDYLKIAQAVEAYLKEKKN